MSKQVKQIIISAMHRKFHAVRNFIVIDTSRVDAASMNRVRIGLAELKINVAFVKNTVAARAVRELGLGDISGVLSGSSTFVFGNFDASELSKIVVKIVETNKNIEIKSGIADGYVVSKDDIGILAISPGRLEVLAELSSRFCLLSSALLSTISAPSDLLGSQLSKISVADVDAP